MTRNRNRMSVSAGVVGLTLAVGNAFAEDYELALKGYCPVSYHLYGRPILGDSASSAPYQGMMYYLADPEVKSKFLADPEKYIPQFGGFCTTALGGTYGNRIHADPTQFRLIDGKLYLFSSTRARNNFDQKPRDYMAMAESRFSKPALGGYSPVAYLTSGKAEKGDEKFKQTYRALVYHFRDADELAAFKKDPDKYLPAYGGFCAAGVADVKRFPGDPTLFAVKDGRVYLFFDAAAKKRFEEGAPDLIQKAEAGWLELSRTTPSP